MAKTLCDLQKKLKKDPESYAKFVVDATHVCKKCGRVANRKKRLCKPLKIQLAPDPKPQTLACIRTPILRSN